MEISETPVSKTKAFYVEAGIHDEYSDAVHVMMGHALESHPHAPRIHYRELDKALHNTATVHNTEYFNKDAGIGPLEACKLQTPTVSIAYQITDDERLQKLKFLDAHHPDGAKEVIKPAEINKAFYAFGKDFLHEPAMIEIERTGDRLVHEPAQQFAMNRMMALQRLQNAIDRTALAERTMLNPQDKTVVSSLREAYAVDGFVNREGADSLEQRCMQKLGSDMADTLNVTTMSKFKDIMAIFESKLDAIGSDVAPAERVAIAISDTAAAVTISLSPQEAQKFNALCAPEAIQGIINESQAEINAENDQREAGTQHEQEYDEEEQDEEEQDDLEH